MKVTGVSIIKNSIRLNYYIQQAIASISDLCDEIIVSDGYSDDGTYEMLQSLNNPKLRLIQSKWDDQLREGGQVLAVETNKVIEQVSPDTDWVIYIQADEVLHEQYLELIHQKMQEHLHDEQVDGLLFKYLHFFGSFDYVINSTNFYRCEIRVFKNNRDVYSYGDAQGFRKGNNQKLRVKLIDAYMHHYGYVRPPQQMLEKQKAFFKLYKDDEWLEKEFANQENYDFEGQRVSIKKFEASHPVLMQNVVETFQTASNLSHLIGNLSFKDRFRHFTDKWLGYWPGEYRNYVLLK